MRVFLCDMWSPVGVPVFAGAVCIKAAGTYTVTLDDTTSVTQLQLGGTGATATLHLASATTTPRSAFRTRPRSGLRDAFRWWTDVFTAVTPC